MNQRPQRKPPMGGQPAPANYYRHYPRYDYRYYPKYRWPYYDYDYHWDYDWDYDWGDYYRDEVVADNVGVLAAYKQGLAEGRLEGLKMSEQPGAPTAAGYHGSAGYTGSTGG